MDAFVNDPLAYWLVETDDGWSVDVAGQLDPAWRGPWLSVGIVLLGALLSWNTTLWVFVPFAALAVAVADVWRGQALYGFRWTPTTLAPVGADPIDVGAVEQFVAEGRTLVMRLTGREHRAELAADPRWVAALAVRLQQDIVGPEGSTGEAS